MALPAVTRILHLLVLSGTGTTTTTPVADSLMLYVLLTCAG